MSGMTADDDARWAEDAAVLAEVGQVIFRQDTRVTVRLPRPLAEKALAAWEREEDTRPVESETREEARTRFRAGTLALIGLSIQQGGRVDNDELVVDLDAWHIGTPYDAAADAVLPLEPPHDRQ